MIAAAGVLGDKMISTVFVCGVSGQKSCAKPLPSASLKNVIGVSPFIIVEVEV